MSLDTTIFTNAALWTLGIQLSGFLVAYTLQTEVFYDILGGINFLLIAFFGWWSNNNSNDDSSSSRRLVAMTCIFFVSRGWLLVFLAWRAHSRKGDSRFDEVKDKFGLFLVFWLVQGIWVFLTSWPLITVQTLESNVEQQQKQQLTVWDIIFLFGFAIGVLIEIVADIQKTLWVNRGRQGTFCAVGIWKYSRHPNYFGEIFQWWCAWLLSYGSLSTITTTTTTTNSSKLAVFLWLLGSLSPLFSMNILLNTSATGIWNAEGKNLKRYYESEHGDAYQEYRESTSPLIPIMVGYKDIPLWIKRTFLFEWKRFEYNPKKKE